MKTARDRKLIRTYTITAAELRMLDTLARYHGLSKSATITGLLRKEFWRLFPGGTGAVRPEQGARIARPPRGRKLEVHP